MNDIIKQIEQADEILLNDIISAVRRRYNALHTDRMASFLALPIDPHERDKEIENIIRFNRLHFSQPDAK